MKYAFTVPNRGPLATPEALGSLARNGEEMGFDSLQTGDHIVVPNSIASRYPYSQGGEFPGGDLGESMEQLTLLSYLAGQTARIRLVTSVIIVPTGTPWWWPRPWRPWTCCPGEGSSWGSARAG